MNVLLAPSAFPWGPAVIAPAFLVLGFAVGSLHFRLLRQTAHAVTEGRVAAPIIHAVARFAVTGAALYFASRLGALPLLSAALGLIAARFVILRSARKPAR